MDNRYLEKIANLFSEALGKGVHANKLKEMELWGKEGPIGRLNEGARSLSQASGVVADTIEEFLPSTAYGRIKGNYTKQQLINQFGQDHAVVRAIDEFDIAHAAAVKNKEHLEGLKGISYHKTGNSNSPNVYKVDFSHGFSKIIDPKNIRNARSAVDVLGTPLNTYVQHVQKGIEGQRALASHEANTARLKLGLGATALGAGGVAANTAYQDHKARKQFEEYYNQNG